MRTGTTNCEATGEATNHRALCDCDPGPRLEGTFLTLQGLYSLKAQPPLHLLQELPPSLHQIDNGCIEIVSPEADEVEAVIGGVASLGECECQASALP